MRRSHSHLTLNARLCILRFFTPSPPYSVGRQHSSQATKHWHPFTFFFSAQKKALSHFSSSSQTHVGASMTKRWWIGFAAIMALTKVNRPALAIRPRCQAGIQLVALSRTTCHSARVRGRKANGSPRYLIGKLASAHPMIDSTLALSSSSPLITVAADLQ